MLIRIRKLYENVLLPVQGSKNAGCYDVYAHEIQMISDSEVLVRLGFCTEIPEGYKGIIVPRSNLTKHNWIISNSPAQIDSDYRGEWMIKFKAIPIGMTLKMSGASLKYEPFPYGVSERVAQIYFERVINPIFLPTDSLSSTERSDGGFGSTGVK